MSFVKKFCAISHRQLQNETRAAEFIVRIMKQAGITYTRQYFNTQIPKFGQAILWADGKRIPAITTSFLSGSISSNHAIVSSLISSQKFIKEPNINFNPACAGISRSNHYFAPSLAIARGDLQKVCQAKRVIGSVRVNLVQHCSSNIMVGNRENPTFIVFCHYDSISVGAIDNASGVAVLLDLIINNPKTLKDTLYVIAGNEELSYDFPVYWGHGYRVFEKKYDTIMKRAQKIFVVDSLGNGPTTLFRDSETVRLGFPIVNLVAWQKKIIMLSGDIDGLLSVYHSDLDTLSMLKEKYLKEATRKLLSLFTTFQHRR